MLVVLKTRLILELPPEVIAVEDRLTSFAPFIVKGVSGVNFKPLILMEAPCLTVTDLPSAIAKF
jgi:hypothetical protein